MILKLVVLSENQQIIGNPKKNGKECFGDICFKCQLPAENGKALECGHFSCSKCITEQGCEYCGLFLSVKDVSTIVKCIEKEVESRKERIDYPKNCQEHQGKFKICLYCKKRICVECLEQTEPHEHDIHSLARLPQEIHSHYKHAMSNYKEAIEKQVEKLTHIENKMQELASVKQLLVTQLETCNRTVLSLSEIEHQMAANTEESYLLAIFDYIDSTFYGYQSGAAFGHNLDDYLSQACKNGDLASVRKLIKLFGNFPVISPYFTSPHVVLTYFQCDPAWQSSIDVS